MEPKKKKIKEKKSKSPKKKKSVAPEEDTVEEPLIKEPEQPAEDNNEAIEKVPSQNDKESESDGSEERDKMPKKEEKLRPEKSIRENLPRRSFYGAEQYEENDEQISYLKLKRHIQRNHPFREDGRRFSIFETIGHLPTCPACCYKKKEDKPEPIKITKIQQEIGLGPTLFLMATKSLAYLFFCLALLHLPVYMFFHGGDKATR